MKKNKPVKLDRYLIPGVYVVLMVLGIPWYLPAESMTPIQGFPLWVFVSLLAAFIGAVFTAWLYLFRIR